MAVNGAWRPALFLRVLFEISIHFLAILTYIDLFTDECICQENLVTLEHVQQRLKHWKRDLAMAVGPQTVHTIKSARAARLGKAKLRVSSIHHGFMMNSLLSYNWLSEWWSQAKCKVQTSWHPVLVVYLVPFGANRQADRKSLDLCSSADVSRHAVTTNLGGCFGEIGCQGTD